MALVPGFTHRVIRGEGARPPGDRLQEMQALALTFTQLLLDYWLFDDRKWGRIEEEEEEDEEGVWLSGCAGDIKLQLSEIHDHKVQALE